MNYHINTIPIWDSFKKGEECPLCTLQGEVDKQLVGQYLNEAVMEDDYRANVNKRGFCREHFVKLYSGENKLGLALQTHTRLLHLLKKLKPADSVKAAKSAADTIRKELDTCTICEVVGFNMNRYYETVPKMFRHEPEFKKLLLSGKGFCLNHYAHLLENASHAGSESKEFISGISQMELENLDRLQGELEYFTEKFDYKNTDKPWGNSKDSLPRSINKIHGMIIKG